MRRAFVNAIFELAAQDPRVAYIGSDLSPELFERMKAEMPGRAFMEGVSEQACIDMAVGMAMEGLIPWIQTIATFLTRKGYEQIALAAQQNLPLRLLGNGGGLCYSHLGPSHLSIDDIALMRSIPNMTVVAPCDAEEAKQLVLASKDYPGPIYFRVGWTQPVLDRLDGRSVLQMPKIEIGKADMLRERYGARVLLVSTGSITAQAMTAVHHFSLAGIQTNLLHCHTVKPLDIKSVIGAAEGVELISVIEEHSIIGGLGSAICDAANRHGRPARLLRIGIPDVWPDKYGERDELLSLYGLQPDQIADRIKHELST